MKKIMILALAALPVFGMAQDKEKAAATTTTTTAAKPEGKGGDSPEVIYVELIAGTNSTGAMTLRTDFGRDVLATLTDKELVKQLTDMRTMNFPSMPDAM